MPSPTVKYGKLFMKDSSGNLVQIMPRTATTVPDYQGATSSAAGVAGLVPAATSANREKFLRGDGTWQEVVTDSDPSYVLTATNPETDQSGTLDDVSGVIFYVPDLNSNQNAEPSEPSEP
jgi:hypothetical protein